MSHNTPVTTTPGEVNNRLCFVLVVYVFADLRARPDNQISSRLLLLHCTPHYSGTPLKGLPWIEDTSLIRTLDQVPTSYKYVLFAQGHLLKQDTFYWPKGVHSREVPLNIQSTFTACVQFPSSPELQLQISAPRTHKELESKLQRNLSNTDTLGTLKCVLIREVSSFRGGGEVHICMKLRLGQLS